MGGGWCGRHRFRAGQAPNEPFDVPSAEPARVQSIEAKIDALAAKLEETQKQLEELRRREPESDPS